MYMNWYVGSFVRILVQVGNMRIHTIEIVKKCTWHRGFQNFVPRDWKCPIYNITRNFLREKKEYESEKIMKIIGAKIAPFCDSFFDNNKIVFVKQTCTNIHSPKIEGSIELYRSKNGQFFVSKLKFEKVV